MGLCVGRRSDPPPDEQMDTNRGRTPDNVFATILKTLTNLPSTRMFKHNIGTLDLFIIPSINNKRNTFLPLLLPLLFWLDPKFKALKQQTTFTKMLPNSCAVLVACVLFCPVAAPQVGSAHYSPAIIPNNRLCLFLFCSESCCALAVHYTTLPCMPVFRNTCDSGLITKQILNCYRQRHKYIIWYY